MLGIQLRGVRAKQEVAAVHRTDTFQKVLTSRVGGGILKNRWIFASLKSRRSRLIYGNARAERGRAGEDVVFTGVGSMKRGPLQIKIETRKMSVG